MGTKKQWTGKEILVMKSEKLDVILLAKWLILLASQRNSSVTNSKLQVLLYYSQVWYLVFYRCKLFSEPLEAWLHGPAVFRVYKHFESKSFLRLPCQSDLPEIPARIKKHLNEILEVYLPFPTEKLEKMVKNESPWQNAYRGLRKQSSSRNRISIENIFSFYASKG